jgi:hypothetical protein
MLTSLIPEDELVTVAVAQTTFIVLTTPKARFRIDFIDKAEAYLKPGMRGNFKSYSEHPLLLSYNSRLATVYISSRPQDPECLLDKIKEQIKAVFQGWRDWHCVLFGKGAFGGDYVLRKNLFDGSGMLLEDDLLRLRKLLLRLVKSMVRLLTALAVLVVFHQCYQSSTCFLLAKAMSLPKTFAWWSFLKKNPDYHVNNLDANEGHHHAT